MKTATKTPQRINTAFFETIIKENENLTFLAYHKNRVLAKDKRNRLHYFYQINNDTSFHFNLISHVAEIHAKWFLKELKNLNFKVEQVETASDYFDTFAPIKNNNKVNYFDDSIYGTELGKAISKVAHPFETLQDKINYANSIEYTKEVQKVYPFEKLFRCYFADKDYYLTLGLIVEEPKN